MTSCPLLTLPDELLVLIISDYFELLKCLSLHHVKTLETIRFPRVKSTTSISLAGFKILRSMELPLTGLLGGKYLGTDEVESDPRDSLSSDLRQIFPQSIEEVVLNPPKFGPMTKMKPL